MVFYEIFMLERITYEHFYTLHTHNTLLKIKI